MQENDSPEEETADIFGMSPEFYRFEILNVVVLIIVGMTLIALTALDILHVLVGVGLVAIMAGFSSLASFVNYLRTQSSGKFQAQVARSFRYRLATALICFVAGGALMVAYVIR